jgi:twitching motility protein PilT
MNSLTLLALLDEMGPSVSDLHLVAGQPPVFRDAGTLIRREGPTLTSEEIAALVLPQLSESVQERYASGHEALCTVHHGAQRFRLQVTRERGQCAAAVRVVPSKVPTLAELELGPIFEKIVQSKRGLIIVTGPTGSGKSTTIAAMVEEINQTRAERILTIEDPMIYAFTSKQSLITQQEVGSDVREFPAALRAALNSDPDVLLIGELRDLESIHLALTLAETGHLVLTPMQCTTTTEAIARLVDAFPQAMAESVRRKLSNNLVAVFAQQLMPRIGGGRVCANEILLATPRIRQMIRDGQQDLEVAIEAGRNVGMQTMDDALAALIESGMITLEMAVERAITPTRFLAK